MHEPAYVLKGFVLIPTYDCTALCAHCCVPMEKLESPERMPLELALRVLEEGGGVGPKTLQISGGEPTLCPEWIAAVFKRALELGWSLKKFPTNGWLGGEPHRLRNFFGALSEMGFSSGMRLSVDGFHKKVSLEAVQSFFEIYAEFFDCKTLVVGACTPFGRERDAHLEAFCEGLRRNGNDCELDWEGGRLIWNGRRVKLAKWSPTRPSCLPLSDNAYRFKPLLMDEPEAGEPGVDRGKLKIEPWGCLGPKGVGCFWIEPNGDVRVCSGNSCVFSDALIAGNARESSLMEIYERILQSPLYLTLAKEGPLGLAARVREFEPDACPDGALFTHRCELCHDILSKKKYLLKLDKMGICR